jgi:hypothetical protein
MPSVDYIVVEGVKPLCIPYTSISPPIIECPQVLNSEIQSPLCDFLPQIESITDFFINLPFLMLFVVSFPARFLYCMVYTYLVNSDQFIQFLLYNIIYPFIDFLTNPFLYFVIGFNNGLNEKFLSRFSFPNQLYGLISLACLSQTLQKLYKTIGSIAYLIGLGVGFITNIIVRLVNFLIDLPCLLAFFTFEFGLSYCVTIDVHTWSNCLTFSFQPFGFLQGVVNKFINCNCALGTSPGISFNFYLPINCNAPSCPSYNPIPYCMIENLLYPIQNSGIVSPQPTINCNEQVFLLQFCQQCLETSENCNLCLEALRQIQEGGCSYPCSQYYCVISNACTECSETNNENACNICYGILNTCSFSGNIGNLPCYSEYVAECNLCYETYATPFCNQCQELQQECKIDKAIQECPPSSS